LINVQLLKWSCEFGIDAAWNLLCGIPGESDAWYADMAKWLELIFHLQPPTGVSRVRYDRFSPYHMRPQEFGLTLQPSRAYGYVYPLSPQSLMRLAYSFEDRERPRHVHRSLTEEPGQSQLQEVVWRWNHSWRASPPVLHVHDEGHRLCFLDTRPCARHRSWSTDGLGAAIYRLCDSAQTRTGLMHRLSTERGTDVTVAEVESAIAELLDAKVMLSLKGKVLALGVCPDRLAHAR
jgi:magnesium-protoporphyrin IX monomethyl ester (oxidative) cyclase